MLLPFAIIALVVAACSAPAAATPSPTDEPTASPTAAATDEPTSSPTEEPTATPAPGIGEQVKVGDEQLVTVTLVEPWEGNDTQQPAAGNAFVAVKIRIDAVTTTDFTSADFTVEDAEGTSYSEAAPGLAPHLSFQDGMTPDTFYEGFVTYEVPEDTAAELVLVYGPDFVDEPVEIQLS